MNKKPTETEVVTALECCLKDYRPLCCCCPFSGKINCESELRTQILELINRKNTEIENLTASVQANDALLKLLPMYKNETRKQFAEKLKALFCPGCDYSAVDIMATIDAVAEELNKDGDNNVPGN